jgi:hypothetical protein
LEKPVDSLSQEEIPICLRRFRPLPNLTLPPTVESRDAFRIEDYWQKGAQKRQGRDDAAFAL